MSPCRTRGGWKQLESEPALFALPLTDKTSWQLRRFTFNTGTGLETSCMHRREREPVRVLLCFLAFEVRFLIFPKQPIWPDLSCQWFCHLSLRFWPEKQHPGTRWPRGGGPRPLLRGSWAGRSWWPGTPVSESYPRLAELSSGASENHRVYCVAWDPPPQAACSEIASSPQGAPNGEGPRT